MINNGITVQQAAENLLNADNILLLCHKNPDGDTLGSAGGLMFALKKLGKMCAICCNDEIPQKYDFLLLKISFLTIYLWTQIEYNVFVTPSQ